MPFPQSIKIALWGMGIIFFAGLWEKRYIRGAKWLPAGIPIARGVTMAGLHNLGNSAGWRFRGNPSPARLKVMGRLFPPTNTAPIRVLLTDFYHRAASRLAA